MSNLQNNTMDSWIYDLGEALNSPQPRQTLNRFFLEVESEAYNRALTDVIRTLIKHGDIGPNIGKIIAMRLSPLSVPSPDTSYMLN